MQTAQLLRNPSCTSQTCFHIILPAQIRNKEFKCSCTTYSRRSSTDSLNSTCLLGKRSDMMSDQSDEESFHEESCRDKKMLHGKYKPRLKPDLLKPEVRQLWTEIEDLMKTQSLELFAELKKKSRDQLNLIFYCFMDFTRPRDVNLEEDEGLLQQLVQRISKKIQAAGDDMTEMFRNAFMLFTTHLTRRAYAPSTDPNNFKRVKRVVLDAVLMSPEFSFVSADIDELSRLMKGKKNELHRRALQKKVKNLAESARPDPFTAKLDRLLDMWIQYLEVSYLTDIYELFEQSVQRPADFPLMPKKKITPRNPLRAAKTREKVSEFLQKLRESLNSS